MGSRAGGGGRNYRRINGEQVRNGYVTWASEHTNTVYR